MDQIGCLELVQIGILEVDQIGILKRVQIIIQVVYQMGILDQIEILEMMPVVQEEILGVGQL